MDGKMKYIKIETWLYDIIRDHVAKCCYKSIPWWVKRALLLLLESEGIEIKYRFRNPDGSYSYKTDKELRDALKKNHSQDDTEPGEESP